MIVMLIGQVIVYVISTSLYPAVTLYLAITTQHEKHSQRVQIETFLNFLGSSFLIYLNPSSTCYIYLLASRSFRQEVKRGLLRSCKSMQGRLQPANTETTQTCRPAW
jgi:hypothetical protein